LLLSFLCCLEHEIKHDGFRRLLRLLASKFGAFTVRAMAGSISRPA
jgi:hypothetical protein